MTQHGRRRIPVILDTDIGSDIDDAWALTMLLKSPELDVKLVLTDTGDTLYRAKIAAKMLELAGRVDVPVGVGIHQDGGTSPQAEWVAGYDLDQYPGVVYREGVQALVHKIMESPEPVSLVCIGPMPNIAAALEREPRIAANARFIGMHGSVRRGYNGSENPSAECNVIQDVAACRRVFAAPWLDRTITPLDTCGLVRLEGERYQRVYRSDDRVTQALIENYVIWAREIQIPGIDPERGSSVLFDTVAVYLAFSTSHLAMERMGLRVTDEGMTVRDDTGPDMNIAIDWLDLEAYKDFLTERMLAPVQQGG
jgi:inosine-uridine nucleoside N-ribohydrolase